jgi:hypothetical protein
MRASRPSCGAIRFEITSFPLLLYSCNCTDCQTAYGERKGRPETMTIRAERSMIPSE